MKTLMDHLLEVSIAGALLLLVVAGSRPVLVRPSVSQMPIASSATGPPTPVVLIASAQR